VCYDYSLALKREIRYIWTGRSLGSAVLYCIIRYSGLACAIMLACMEFSVVEATKFVLSPVSHIFSGLRVYAVSDRSTWVLASVVFLNVLSPAVYVV
ncbi:hypothetical protein BV20DRAFT_915605, partial [Pilatotrama ljubarskyi]